MFYLIYSKLKWTPNALRKAASYWYSNARLATLQVLRCCHSCVHASLYWSPVFAVLLYMLVDQTKFCYVSLSISSLTVSSTVT